MSRVIVKGLPTGVKDTRLKNIFGESGTITDCSLKYTKSGQFRKFAFLGFSTQDEANNAVKRFNQSYIDTSKILVEIAKDFGDETKPRSWSKYSRDSSAYQRMIQKLEEKKAKAEGNVKKDKSKKKQKNEQKVDELLGDLKGDEEFQEFLEVHKNKTTKSTWSNDTTVTQMTNQEKSPKGSVTYDDSDDEGDSDAEDVIMNEEKEEQSEEEKTEEVETKKELTDLDYLKSKMTDQKELLESSSDESSDSSSEPEEPTSKKERKKRSKNKNPADGKPLEEELADQKKKKKKEKKNKKKMNESDTKETGEESDKDRIEEKEQDKQKSPEPAKLKATRVTHVVKMRGMPSNLREKQVRDFFDPLDIRRVKIPKNAKGNNATSVATVEFLTDKDTDQAMRKNKNFMASKRIFLYKVKRDVQDQVQEKTRPWESKAADERDEEDETIAESGRLYVRNLAYICKEEDLEALFGKYGQLTEVHLPIDSLTRKIKGFAFVTFMIPEHAVKAFSELDGASFQGRMLHILPAKAKKEEESSSGDLNYKKKREMKQKAQAGSSHNWNTLFLGANVVADVMAEKYGAEKSHILDPEAKQSLGVRLALGETEIVAETRKFLVDNGIALDSFSQAAAARSKTVMLVKNLPAGTKCEVIREMFAKFGLLGRVVLPPSGITAVVEFLAPTEARAAFRTLAYTKFQHVPLYLEWAPIDIFVKPAKSKTDEKGDEEKKERDEDKEEPMNEESGKTEEAESSSSENEEDELEPESTIFVKNLNYETNEESLEKHFGTCGEIRAITISKKKDMKNPGQLLSMGYGFIEFKKKESAQKALKTLQHSQLDEHQVELKISNKTTIKPAAPRKKQDTTKKQRSTKILVRNIPFEAKQKEIRELFGTFGELKTLRLPKKLGGTGTHRGFCFVDFLTKQDAKRAFNALCHSTHLYGRRLVLEWADSDESVEQLRKKTAEHFHDEGPSKRLKKSDLLNELKLSADD